MDEDGTPKNRAKSIYRLRNINKDEARKPKSVIFSPPECPSDNSLEAVKQAMDRASFEHDLEKQRLEYASQHQNNLSELRKLLDYVDKTEWMYKPIGEIIPGVEPVKRTGGGNLKRTEGGNSRHPSFDSTFL